MVRARRGRRATEGRVFTRIVRAGPFLFTVSCIRPASHTPTESPAATVTTKTVTSRLLEPHPTRAVVGPPDLEPDCFGELACFGVKYQRASLPVHTAGKKPKITCGAPGVVTYVRGPGKISYNAAPLLTCGMALALATWDGIVQAEATKRLGLRVVRIDQIGTYSCREVSAYPGTVSEHSYANAIDIGRFVLANGASVDVLHDFDQSETEPKKPAAAFLRAISRRGSDEDIFSHVLTPFFNAEHKNHFHLDLARYRADGTRPE